MGEAPISRRNIKNESLAIVGIGLSATAIGVSFLSFLVFSTPQDLRDSLFSMIVSSLIQVNNFFVTSSLLALGSYLLCYVRDLTIIDSKQEFYVTIILVAFLGFSIILLVYGIFQLMGIIPLFKGVT